MKQKFHKQCLLPYGIESDIFKSRNNAGLLLIQPVATAQFEQDHYGLLEIGDDCYWFLAQSGKWYVYSKTLGEKKNVQLYK